MGSVAKGKIMASLAGDLCFPLVCRKWYFFALKLLVKIAVEKFKMDVDAALNMFWEQGEADAPLPQLSSSDLSEGNESGSDSVDFDVQPSLESESPEEDESEVQSDEEGPPQQKRRRYSTDAGSESSGSDDLDGKQQRCRSSRARQR